MSQNQLRAGMPPLPARMQNLPIDDRGYVVPRFVQWLFKQENPEARPQAARFGEKGAFPEFRIMDGAFRMQCVKSNLCWVCGQSIPYPKENYVFLAGPMCGLNRISAEPPSHWECAEFSAMACPFMVLPKMERRDNDLPPGLREKGNPGGMMIDRNPGVAMAYVTKSYQIVSAAPSFLFKMGAPVELHWFARGRQATRGEVLAAIESGIPLLLEAEKGMSKIAAAAEVGRLKADFMPWLPKE